MAGTTAHADVRRLRANDPDIAWPKTQAEELLDTD
jgi:hypothetical protein